MNALLALIISMVVHFTAANLPAFDKTVYLSIDGSAEMLDRHFIKDLHSPELYRNLKYFMGHHFDQLEHISGYYAPESDLYYYALYGRKRGEMKVDFLVVAKELFDNSAYYQFAYQLPARGHCRRGNGYAASSVCAGTACDSKTEGCLGIICPPAECL